MQIGDAADVFAYASDPAVLRYTTGVTPTRVEETETWLRATLADEDTLIWAIRFGSDPTVIGAIEMAMSSPEVGSVHYALARSYWRRGLMTEAVETVCNWAFAVPELMEVNTVVAETNAASLRVLEKCGFRRFGVAMEHWPKSRIPVRCVLFRLTRDSTPPR